jgi:asparagine synthase (glutamine-hydrolysing)
MTIFAGVFALDANRDVTDGMARELAGAISRSADDKPSVMRGPGCAMAYLDLGLLPGRGEHVAGDGSRSVLAGDLLLNSRESVAREDDLRSLHEAWSEGDSSPLSRARGTFAVAMLDPARGVLRLAVDLFGARPIYIGFFDGFVYFSTALRILEGLASLKKRLDHRGLLELTAFGFPLSTRTPYEDIEMLDGAELVEVSRTHGVRRTKYFEWGDLQPIDVGIEELSCRLHRSFQEAVSWRVGKQRSVLSFFSGGLDSRCVTASLLAGGAQVHSVNIAPEGSIDLVLGRTAAQHLGTRHFEYPSGPGPNKVESAHSAWLATLAPHEQPDFPRAVWTGNGGSVGVGHVYLSPEMVVLMRQGRRREAVRAYLRKNRIELSPKAFQPSLRGRLEACCFDGVLEEVMRLPSFDEGRRLHLFLMMNDQRRHLCEMYEEIDTARVEPINPFFDAQFMRLILASPIEPFLQHRFYNEWLKEFPYELDAIPWQAYDDHAPCPHPIPAQLNSQWGANFYSERALKEASARLLAHSSEALANPQFPNGLLRRPVMQVAWWMTKTGIRDYSYLLNIASNLTHYASKASA